VVLAACVAFGAVAACWSVLVPLTEAPDEPAHLALVLHLADGHGYPSYDGLHNQQAIVRLCATYAAATRACPRKGEPVTPTSTRRHPRSEAPDRSVRPAWDDAGGDQPLGQLNQMPQHPPLYYEAMAAVLRVERAVHGGAWSADRELALLRLVNALIVMPLPGLAWWSARRLRLSRATCAAAAVALLGLPMLTYIGATLNNDNLLTLCGAALVALLAGVVGGDRTWKTGLAVGAVTGVALLTKAFAIVFPPLIVVAYLVGWRADRGEADELTREEEQATAKEWGVPLVVAGLATAVLSAWWYVGVKVRTGKFAPTVEDAKLTTALRPSGFHAHVGPFAREFARSIDQRFWGSFGWYTVRLSTGLTYALTAVVAALVVIAFVGRRTTASGADGDGTDHARRAQLAFLLVPMALLGAFVLQHAWSLHVRTSKFQFIQGRYLFAGVAGLAVLVAIGTERLAGRWAAISLAVAGGALQAWAAWRCLVGYWGGPGLGPRGQLRAMGAWSAWPGTATGMLGVALVASLGWLAWCLASEVRGPRSAEGAPVGSVG
jgi:small subunit ribosomal protein S36